MSRERGGGAPKAFFVLVYVLGSAALSSGEKKKMHIPSFIYLCNHVKNSLRPRALFRRWPGQGGSSTRHEKCIEINCHSVAIESKCNYMQLTWRKKSRCCSAQFLSVWIGIRSGDGQSAQPSSTSFVNSVTTIDFVNTSSSSFFFSFVFFLFDGPPNVHSHPPRKCHSLRHIAVCESQSWQVKATVRSCCF